MTGILDMIFSREIPVSLGEQLEIDRRVKQFKLFFYKELFTLEQQPSKEAAENFLNEMKAFIRKNAFPKPTEDHPRDPRKRKMWAIRDQCQEEIARAIESQAERYEFSDDLFWREFGSDLFFRRPQKGIIM